MHDEYNGVKYYGDNDMSIGYEMQQSEKILLQINHLVNPNINQILELYNIKKLFEIGSYPTLWGEQKYLQLKANIKSIPKIIGRFFSCIKSSQIPQLYSDVCIDYIEDFWNCLEDYNIYKNICDNDFKLIIYNDSQSLFYITKNRKLVKQYGYTISEALKHYCVIGAQLLIRKFCELNDINEEIYLPNELAKSDYEPIISSAIDSGDLPIGRIQVLATMQSEADFPISDKLKLKAKHFCEKYFRDHEDSMMHMQYGVSLEFQKLDTSIVKLHKENREGIFSYEFTYDLSWLEENTDYPTIFNNFYYVFDQFDPCWRSTLVSVSHGTSIMEKVIGAKGKKSFPRNHIFHFMSMLSTLQVQAYQNFLIRHELSLEDGFKWFFETYLPTEFNISGFRFNPPSLYSTWIEKCRNLASEMDGVIKQYSMYVEDGSIDWELFEISSKPLKSFMIPSLLKDKYGYSSSKELDSEMELLFSDQTLLGYLKEKNYKYPCAYDLLCNEKIMVNEYKPFQRSQIDFLIQRGSLSIDNSGLISLNKNRVLLLKDLYDKDVLCLKYHNKRKAVIDSLVQNGQLVIEDSLLSKPEQNYLDYVLNKATYSDGLDLRNKYIHSSYPHNSEKQQESDYIQLLKIMIILVVKMNEEICIRDEETKDVEK